MMTLRKLCSIRYQALGLFVLVFTLFGVGFVTVSAAQTSDLPTQLVQLVNTVDQHWATRRYKTRDDTVMPFLVPLGSMKKIQGNWRLEAFEAVSGDIRRITWSVEGENINEMFSEVAELISAFAEQRWQCTGRACGNAAEWASRVYQERLLYGRDEFTNYTVFQTLEGDWLTLFSAARTADRQYLHMDIVSSASK